MKEKILVTHLDIYDLTIYDLLLLEIARGVFSAHLELSSLF